MLNNFRVFETDRFVQRFNETFGGSDDKMKKKLDGYVYPQLIKNPYFGKNIKKLKNYNPPTWRYRIGKYRFFYIIDNKTRVISIMTVSIRGDSYKK